VPDEPGVGVVVAGGLMAIKPGAGIYYRDLCQKTGAELVLPHRGGIGPFMDTYKHFEARLDELSADGRQLVIIGHSHVHSLLLLGVPIKGSILAYVELPIRALTSRIAPIIGQLVPGSQTIKELEAHLPHVLDRTTCVHARLDAIVIPSRSTYIHNAHRHIKLPWWVNHVLMINHQHVLDEASRLIDEAVHAQGSTPALAIAS
jgi:hypothetical protein